MSKKVAVFKLDDLESIDTFEGLMSPISANEHVSIIYNTVSPQLHVHPHVHNNAYALLLLKGAITLVLTDEHFHLSEGSVAIIPAGEMAGFSNHSEDTPAAMLMISFPSKYTSLDGLKEALQSLNRRTK
jgi:quercetin dioxygenase-like cupin family protein